MKTGITAMRISEKDRPDFLPRHCGRHRTRFEDALVAFASVLCPECPGGDWELFDMSNGGFYLAPKRPEGRPQAVPVIWEPNGFEGRMSADAFGVVATMYALNHLAWKVGGRFGEELKLLRDYAGGHEEAGLILAATA